MNNSIDNFLSFLPGMKAYLAGGGMILTGASQIVEAIANDAWFGPTFMSGLEMALQGFAVMGIRRGIKTDIEAVKSPSEPFTIPIDAPVISTDIHGEK